ncbi:HAMP domain-containing histidine kinase [Microbacterium sp. JC 701]|uniref:sensor histidine kinase n=1 Tax=Microbacterium sp. JC 701 TaxID=2897389 RepID=UPI001E64E609|nr:HAMP domain-containing sensor histidine kinase [Microbacterium sp. JC 701]MCD2169645.1 HAMP domain-containing histidine kinase [Microbacterium sp. JC 701]
MVEAMAPFNPSEGLGLRRSIVSNQSLLAAAATIGVIVSIVLGQVRDPALFFVGAAVVYAGTIAAVLVRWETLPRWALLLLPGADVVVIAVMRESAPVAGLGLLWAFPALWIGGSFGLRGVVGVSSVVSILLLHQTITDNEQRFASSTFILPFIIAALSSMAHLTARRARAQRALLEKQSAELRRAVERAQRQEDLVTEVLDAVDFGVTRITATGEFAVTNTAHGLLLNTTDAFGHEIAVFAADGSTAIAASASPLARARAGEVFESEMVWYGLPGEDRRALSVTARRLPAPGGVDAGGVVVSRDVTVEEQARRAREDLVASVSHELRTPLTSIIGYLDLVLDDDTLGDVARDRLEIAERNASRLLELVADILSQSTDSGGGSAIELDRSPTDIAALVRAAVESIEPRARDHGIRILTGEMAPIRAVVDARRVRQIVDNLLSNAVKYIPRGASITVTVTADVQSLSIVVADDGPGISPSEQARLFERFFRGDAVRKTSTHGSGLGLAISRDLARAHGGEITVRTASGEGATFTVRLPRDPKEGA